MGKVLGLFALLAVALPLGSTAGEAYGIASRVESGNGYIKIAFSSMTRVDTTVSLPPLNNGSFTGSNMYQLQIYYNVITDADSRKEMLSTALTAQATGQTLRVVYNIDTLKHMRITTE
jgi:hypothetical protein